MTSATTQGDMFGGAVPDFEAVIECYQKKVYGLTYRMTGNHADADCVTQETFLKAYKGFRKFRGTAGLGTWLYRIASNACMDYLRTRGRQETLLEARRTEEAVHEDSSREGAEVAERRDAVQTALENLDAQDRMIITLTSMEGFSHREAGEILDIPIATVSWKITKIKENLANKLARFVEEES